MSKLEVTSIAALEKLKEALNKHQVESGESVRRFDSIFSEKINLLSQLKSHFEGKIEQAENELSSAEMAYVVCTSNPESISCAFEESSVRNAEAELARSHENSANYHSAMSRLQDAFGAYSVEANSYKKHLHAISSTVVPDFTTLINKMKMYAFENDPVSNKRFKQG